jgi:hypothetical protein
MPIHDWKAAPGGYFHHFHQYWSVAICTELNSGLLPRDTYALVEQSASEGTPDVLALESSSSRAAKESLVEGGVALAEAVPKTTYMSRVSEEQIYAAKANRVVLHRGDEVVAVIEIVSPGNKSSVAAIQRFVQKSVAFLDRGIHLLVVDLFPPTARDPQGIHPEIWGRFADDGYVQPLDRPLTLASYVAGMFATAYIEPVAVGGTLPDMPIFLETGRYVPVPLGSTYEAAWNSCPEIFRQRVAG